MLDDSCTGACDGAPLRRRSVHQVSRRRILRTSHTSGRFITSAVTTLVGKETKSITTATPVIQPAMPIVEGIHIISTAFEDQSRPPFLQATRSWNLVPPTQNVTLPQPTSDSKPNSTSHNGRIPRVPQATGQPNGLLIGGAVGGVLGVLLLMVVIWYFCRARQRKKQEEDGDDRSPADGFMSKLGFKKRPSRKKTPRFSVSDLESVTTGSGDATHSSAHKEKSSGRSPPNSPPELEPDKTRRSWRDARVLKLFSRKPHGKAEGGNKDKKDEYAASVDGQSPLTQDRGTPNSRSPSVKASISRSLAVPDNDSRHRAPRATSREDSVRSQRPEVPRQQSRTGGRRDSFDGSSGPSDRNRRMPLATVRESSTHSQQRKRRSSDPGSSEKGYDDAPSVPEHAFLQPGQQRWPTEWKASYREPSSAYSRTSRIHSSEDSTEFEAYLEGMTVAGAHRKEDLPRGPARTANMPGMAF